MKKYILIIGLLFAVSSCELDVPLRSNIPVEDFFKTEEDFELALNGVYEVMANHQDGSGFGSYFRGLMVLGRAGTDEGYSDPLGAQYALEISNYTFSAQSIVPTELWISQYRGIGRANTVLSRLASNADEIGLDQDTRYRIEGEAKFMRAFYYFQLVRFFGGVPINTQEIEDVSQVDQLDKSRKSIEEVYAQIIADFKDAEEKLPENNTDGRAEKYAATAFLAKVYLQMSGEPLNDTSKATLAAQKANEVISSGYYSLLPVYEDIFSLENEYSSEYIFSVQYDYCGICEGGQVGTWDGPPGVFEYTQTYSLFRTFEEHYLNYNQDGYDLRRDYNIIDYVVYGFDEDTGEALTRPLNDGNYYAFKWRHDPNPENRPGGTGFIEWQSAFDFPLTRYADILLIYAEAKMRIGEIDASALSAINDVRLRGFGISNGKLKEKLMAERITESMDDIAKAQEEADIDQEIQDLKDDVVVLSTYDEEMILDERKRELCYEGHRWHDLVRFGKLVEAVKGITSEDDNQAGANIEAKHTLLPIPLRAIQSSNLEQNPGW